VKLAVARRFAGTKVLYCPFPYSRNARIIEKLLDAERNYEIVVPSEYEQDWPGAIPFKSLKSFKSLNSSDEAFGKRLCEVIDLGFQNQGVELLEEDGELLREQINEVMLNVAGVETGLRKLKPDAILVPSDNHSPFIEAVLVARREGIPSIMLQHGLDCERFYLDQAYASHIAVWGKDREDRYRRDSTYQPEQIGVVGNPAYDGIDVPAEIAPGATSWLWLTRPHRSEKCYAPSRESSEGLQIFEAILEALTQAAGAQLMIETHTFDDPDLYRARLDTYPDPKRVTFPETGLFDLIDGADLVIAEDSTAGMDAMIRQKVLIHAHLALSAPVMPFVDYAAALPGFSHEEIAASLCRAAAMSDVERAAMHTGQAKFLDDFAGPRDGRAGERFVEFVAAVMNEA